MSEYQYYEFLAIDRPLTHDDMEVLRGLSSRATITPVSFTNEYNWGSFKGDPEKLMLAYFDAHVYVANWMSATLMVRLPIEALDKKTAQAFNASEGKTKNTQGFQKDMKQFIANYSRRWALFGRLVAAGIWEDK